MFRPGTPFFPPRPTAGSNTTVVVNNPASAQAPANVHQHPAPQPAQTTTVVVNNPTPAQSNAHQHQHPAPQQARVVLRFTQPAPTITINPMLLQLRRVIIILLMFHFHQQCYCNNKQHMLKLQMPHLVLQQHMGIVKKLVIGHPPYQLHYGG